MSWHMRIYTSMSDRITKMFAALKNDGRKALVGYMTCGDPDMTRSEANVRAALDGGVDLLELGIPFSDPTADGPAIQEASQRALSAGTTLRGALDMVRRLRADYAAPIILFGYANPFLAYGLEAVSKDAADAGADGMLIVDIPWEESAEVRVHMDKHGLVFVPLIAPTTPRERAARILKDAGGFVYYIMVTGVTGARDTLAADVGAKLADIRACTDLPIVVGFGISSGEQASSAAEQADGVVVGSALVKAAAAGSLPELVHELSSALG
jgi:tryptophan synthase alpha chain